MSLRDSDLGLEWRRLQHPDLLDHQVGLGHLQMFQTETLQLFSLSQQLCDLAQVSVVRHAELE